MGHRLGQDAQEKDLATKTLKWGFIGLSSTKLSYLGPNY